MSFRKVLIARYIKIRPIDDVNFRTLVMAFLILFVNPFNGKEKTVPNAFAALGSKDIATVANLLRHRLLFDSPLKPIQEKTQVP